MSFRHEIFSTAGRKQAACQPVTDGNLASSNQPPMNLDVTFYARYEILSQRNCAVRLKKKNPLVRFVSSYEEMSEPSVIAGVSVHPDLARAVLLSALVEEEFMGQKPKVMLIEDNEDCREVLAAMIRLMGYEAVLPGGKPADETADVIVVYLDFPQMRTILTIRALRDDQRTKDTPIIVFLPWTYENGTLAALDAGANEVFDGPLRIETLRDGIEKYAPESSDPCEPAGDMLTPVVANDAPTNDDVTLAVA
jgi:CheY-like chemotaxis protein